MLAKNVYFMHLHF